MQQYYVMIILKNVYVHIKYSQIQILSKNYYFGTFLFSKPQYLLQNK